MTSLWLAETAPIDSDAELPESGLDDLVVGAGLTGLTTALLLARAGRKVAVVEARHVGAAATGNTTAKLSLLQGTKLSAILAHQSKRVAAAYVAANLQGQQWLLRFCADHGVPFQIREAITYAAGADELSAVQREHEAAASLDLPVRWEDDLDVPFPSHGATVLADQAQFDPMDVLAALVEQLRAHGGTLHQGLRVVSVSKTGMPRVTLSDETSVSASNVVLATGAPILDRGLYFAKLEAHRSYALTFDVDGAVPSAMFLSAGATNRSLRTTPGGVDGKERLLVGGAGHVVGRTRSETEHVDELRHWTDTYFPGSTETHVWSAQDYRSHDGIPYVGKLPRGGGRIYVASGFDKWGMSNAVAAARSISAQILDQPPTWARVLNRRITRPAGVRDLLVANAGVAAAATRSLVSAEMQAVAEPSAGEGSVGRAGVLPVGVSNQGGQTCGVAALCTHLGGVLKWNDLEHSWDCPLHGSRFAPDGEVLEGPATRPLKPHQL